MATTNIPAAGITDEPHHPECKCRECEYAKSTDIIEQLPVAAPAKVRATYTARPINWNDPDVLMEAGQYMSFRNFRYDDQAGGPVYHGGRA